MTELQMLSVGYALFALAIGLELAWSKLRGDGRYRLGQLVVNVGHGMLFQVFDGFTKALVLVPIVLVSAVAPVALPLDAVWAWILAFLAYDFLSYWRHRHHHEVAALWAIHGIHHAAQDFNLAAALRQAIFQNVVAWIWFLPLALFVPLEMFLGLVVLDYVYQFFQHTQYVGKLGPIEWIFNTPSHHRVHHGTQPQYIDKNYGGMLIVWDRLFGTFEEEGEAPVYGLTRQLDSLNPLWGNFALWRDLGVVMSQTPGVLPKLGVLLGSTERFEQRYAELEGERSRPQHPTSTSWRPVYVGLAFFSAVPVLAALAWIPPEAGGLRIALSLVVVLTALSTAALLEHRRHAWTFEGARVVFATLVALVAVATTL